MEMKPINDGELQPLQHKYRSIDEAPNDRGK